MVVLNTKTRNALKCIDCLLRVASEELIHLQFEKLTTKGSSAVTSSVAWARFCCKMWRDSLVRNQYSHRFDAEVKLYKYQFPI